MAYPPIGEEVTVEIHIADDVFVKQLAFKCKGHRVEQHRHDYDHVSMLAVGSVRAWMDGVDKGIVHAPTGIHIPAGTTHQFEALEDWTVMYCIHNMAHADSLKG